MTISANSNAGFLDGSFYVTEFLLEDYNKYPVEIEGDATVHKPEGLRFSQANAQVNHSVNSLL